MTRRDMLAALAGALVALYVMTSGLVGHRDVIGQAQAQAQAPREVPPEQLRYLFLALAAALASVAVDGERTAMVHNETADRVADLADRLASLEKRLADLEKKR